MQYKLSVNIYTLLRILNTTVDFYIFATYSLRTIVLHVLHPSILQIKLNQFESVKWTPILYIYRQIVWDYQYVSYLV